MLSHRRQPIARRGLSLLEMLIALAISAMLLTAALSALDVMFKGYKQTTESASTHVVSRIVMSRRAGTSWGAGRPRCGSIRRSCVATAR